MPSTQTALEALRVHTKIDIDALDVTVAARFNNEFSTSTGFFFGDMTGNQAITLGAVLSLESTEKDELLRSSLNSAKRLLEFEQDKDVLSIPAEGSDSLVCLAVDVLTVTLCLAMAPYLPTTGSLHAQVAPSLLPSTEDIVAHALRFDYLYHALSPDNKAPRPVCIKIPANVEGLRACKVLEEKGVRTLATTTFSVEQGLASAEGAGCKYVAPYVNALEAHSYERNNVPASERRFADIQPSIDVVHEMQAQFRARKARGAKFDTEVLAASFLSARESLRLAGIDRQTLSPAVLQELAETMVSEEEAVLLQASLASLDSREKAIKGEEIARIEWLEDRSEGLAMLRKALEGERTMEMLKDALGVFGKAESELKELVREVT